jgi:hypothetical protein
MNHDLKEADSKKPYEPPQLTAISLRPEEAVLGHCKTMTTGGPAAATCFPLCNSSIGS